MSPLRIARLGSAGCSRPGRRAAVPEPSDRLIESNPIGRYRSHVRAQTITGDQIMAAAAITFALATACQLLAPKLRVPALILLLPVGFIAGQVFPIINVEEIFGTALTPMVNLIVAVILFKGGLELSRLHLDAPDARVVRRLVWFGSALTWLGAGLGAYYIVGLPASLSVLVGAILIVSGPTVVTPLLEFVRPNHRVRRILTWEGTLIDPIGALIAVVVFQAVKVTNRSSVAVAVSDFFGSMLVGLGAGLLGLLLIKAGLRLSGSSKVLGTQVLLGAVIVATGLANYLAEDSGLVAAVTMGMVTPFIVGRERLEHVEPFFDTIVQIAIGVLFIAISALVTPASLSGLVLPSIGLVLLLVIVVRPVTALSLTIGSPLTMRERMFIGWVDPRGIVAAASAASFVGTLVAAGMPEARTVLPVVFLVIAGTVLVYGLTALPVARLLGVLEDDPAAWHGGSRMD